MPLARAWTRDHTPPLAEAKRTRAAPTPPFALPRPLPARPHATHPQRSARPQTYSDALEQESARVVAAVQTPLRALVSVRLASTSSTCDLFTPAHLVLTLHFVRRSDPQRLHQRRESVWRVLRRSALDTKRITPALDAIALVATHARLLHADARLHAAFWTALLNSGVLAALVPGDVHAWLQRAGSVAAAGDSSGTQHEPVAAQSPSPPRIVLDFGHPRAKLDTRCFDALYKFLTEPQPTPEVARQFPDARRDAGAPTKLLFGLSFADARLSTTALTAIQRLLDCVALGCSRHYGIDLLDLRRSATTPRQLDVVHAIVRRNHLYQIADIRLDDTPQRPLAQSQTTKAHSLLSAAIGSAAVRRATEWRGASVFAGRLCPSSSPPLHASPVASVSKSPVASSPSTYSYSCSYYGGHDSSGIRFGGGGASEWRMSLPAATPAAPPPHSSPAANPLSIEHIASVCSTLRYGCALDELSVAAMLRGVAPADRPQCWRWLAFGLFYPRSARFAHRFALRTVELANAELSALDMDAFADALYNPAAELRRPGAPEDPLAMDAVLVAVAESGAQIFALPDARSPPLATLAHAQELEILHSHDDREWVCAVVAGVGLGWLAVKHVVSVESDLVGSRSASPTLSPASSCRRGSRRLSSRGGATPSDTMRLELVVHSASPASRVISAATQTFIETVGRHLRALAVRDCAGLSIQDIAYHCKHVTHLDLAGCDLADGGAFRDLVGCLNGHFGRRLVALNLSRTRVTNADVAALAKVLGNPRKLPRLRELRLVQARINHTGLESLHAALRRNKTLAVLELDAPGADAFDDWTRAARERMDAECQGQSLQPVPLGRMHKLALVSAVLGRQSRCPCSGDKGDASALSRAGVGASAAAGSAAAGSDCGAADSTSCESLSQRLRQRAPRVFELIFAFAAEPVRRQIVWTTPVRVGRLL